MPTGSLYPLTFLPILKDRVWGGRRLHELYRKQLPPAIPVGESWEISDRVGNISVVANGAFAGKDLHWLIEHLGADLLNGAKLQHGRFPLLIKILDATDKLSLQVHPPESKARLLGGEPKTELWYIAEARPGAELYVGLRHSCTRDQFTQKLKDGSVADCFHRLPVKTGDAMFLPSGRVHALGAGMVIFEIQQNSDTTYRVFDWNRVGLDGKPRELHVKQSLESIDFSDFEPAPLRQIELPGSKTVRSLLRDELFSVDLAVLHSAEALSLPSGIMRIIGVVRGELGVRYASGNLTLSAGQFCLIPAGLGEVNLEAVGPQVECLCVRAGNGDL
jgi:mannose-6-phosphate isomerase